MMWQGVYIIHVTQDREKWLALAKTLIGSLVS
jgi:hypothetical protein